MKNNAYAVVTHGQHTDITVKIYSNRIFLIITHFKKLGSLIEISRGPSFSQHNNNTYSTKVLFGKDDVEIIAAARYIAEQINVDKPLLISLSLKDYDSDTLKPIVAAIKNIKVLQT